MEDIRMQLKNKEAAEVLASIIHDHGVHEENHCSFDDMGCDLETIKVLALVRIASSLEKIAGKEKRNVKF